MLQPTRQREKQMKAALALPAVAQLLRHEGWYSPYEETEPIDFDEDFDQFARAMSFIDHMVMMVPTKIASGKVTSMMLKTYYEQKCREQEYHEEEIRERTKTKCTVVKPDWYGYVSHGVFILAAIASGLTELRPPTTQECGSAYLTICSCDWKDLP
jgi:hypothetical protein